MGTMANSSDPDELPHHAAFHQGHQCLLRLKQSTESKVHLQLYLEILSCYPLICTMIEPS